MEAIATAALQRSATPGPVYYVHRLSAEYAIVARRAYIGAPVFWIEWDAHEANCVSTFENFTYGYSPLQPLPTPSPSHPSEPDDFQDSEVTGPSLR